jgi:hypothetical protein
MREKKNDFHNVRQYLTIHTKVILAIPSMATGAYNLRLKGTKGHLQIIEKIVNVVENNREEERKTLVKFSAGWRCNKSSGWRVLKNNARGT